MRYYPVFLDIKGKPSVVIGGGAVAERKVESLLSAGAAVTVISPRAAKGIRALASRGGIRLVKKAYSRGMLEGAFIVVCAAGAKAVNEAVRQEARGLGALVNVVDDPGSCDFIVPSIVDRGSLILAISTSGKSPMLAKTIREGLEEAIGGEYETFVDILGAVRKKLLKSKMNSVKKKRVFKELVNSPIPGWLRTGAAKEINGYLKGLLGKGYLLAELGIKGGARKRP
ncbi:MAG: bifunctional precorrin-2 dehydrogenase/sirohydrochlorin ferrochelatase [Deltaproteobacteria bacterium]|nr:bifunctional precorrin-2 dehydrogenase/sirohydrochlorin ferrochelatase [Deltaproteobacteria bacterium]